MEPNAVVATAMAAGAGMIGQLLRAVRPGQENIIDLVAEQLADGTPHKRVTLGQRTLQAEAPKPPQRAESPRRAHRFADLAGFVAYLRKYKSTEGDTVVLADVGNQTIAATLDEKAVSGFEVVTLKPAVHPLFAPWADLLEAGQIEIGKFAEFLLANRRVVSSPDGMELVATFSQVRASVNTTIKRGIGNKSINGVMVTVEIAGESKAQPVDLPNSITIQAPLFVGTSEQDIEIDLLLTSPSAGVIAVTLTSAGVLEARVAAFLDMLEAIRGVEGLTVGMGRPAVKPWAYVGEERDAGVGDE